MSNNKSIEQRVVELNDKMLHVNERDIYEDTKVYTYYQNPLNYKIDRLMLQMKMVKEQIKLLQEQITQLKNTK